MATNKDFIVKSGLQVQSTATSTSITSGALIVAGGAGIAGDLWVGGNIYLDGVGLDTVQGTTATFKNVYVTGTNVSTSTTTGAVTIAGGLGVAGNIYGTAIYDNGIRVLTSATIGTYGVTSLIAGTDTAVSASTGAVTVWNTGTLQSVTNRGAATTNAISITNTTDSTTTGTGALIVSGGVAVGKQLSADSIDIFSTTDVGVGTGALVVAGGAYIAKAVRIDSTAASTSTAASNALYVTGGAYIGTQLTVGGTTLFKDNVTFAGTATYVYSTNTFYTDNILELHTPPGGVNANWTLDDGKDIGLRFHYYANSTDTNAALVMATDTKFLEWYNSGAEGANVFTSATYGTFKTGAIILTSSTVATSTITGALIINGGAGIGGSVYASALYDNGARVLTTATIGSSGVTSIIAGSDISVSSATGNVTVSNTSTFQTVTSRGATTTNAISITNATAASSTTTGALKVTGGIGALNVYASALYDNSNRVLTSVTVTAGTGLSGGGTISGPTGTVAFTNTGVLSLTAGNPSIGISTSSGAITLSNLGVTSIAGTTNQITVSASTGSVTLSLPSSITVTTGTFTSIIVSGTDPSFSATTGALQVVGGIGVGKSVFVGTTATVAGTFNRTGGVTATGWGTAGIGFVLSTATFTDTSLSGAQAFAAVYSIGRPTLAATNTPTYTDAATLYIDNSPLSSTSTVITNPWSLYVAQGNVKIATTTASSGAGNGALVVGGGVGVGGALNVTGAGSFGATGVTVGNTLISSYTSGAISTTSTQNLDTFTTSTYRSAKYTVQVVDAAKVHITEMMVFHDNTTVYKMEYGISSNTGELGTFDASLGAGTITLTFTPNYTPTSMVIKANRTSIAT